MKIVKKSQTHTFQTSDVCKAIEYPMGDSDINGAIIELTGRYPTQGKVVNTKCKELAYIISGSGKLILENEEIDVNEGDLILVEPNENYCWEGTMTMFVPCTPAWYPQQHMDVK
jgi:mannose-6-phosphate isomerase-like protein (cupin superfamily)